MKKRWISFVLLAALLIALAACGRSGEKDAEESAPPEMKGPITFCLGAAPESLDPSRYAVGDDATYLVNLYAGLVTYRPDEQGNVCITADLCRALPEPETGEDGKPSYTFALRSGLKWSDGTDLTAQDFVYSWNRAAFDADVPERELFACIDGFADGTLNVTASEDGKKLTVVLEKATPRFMERLANPVFFPVQEAACAKPAWDVTPFLSVTSGAYRLADLSDKGMTLEKNPEYWDAENTTLDQLKFDFSEDPDAILDYYRAGRYCVASSLPAGSAAELAETEGDALHVTGRMGNYCLCFRVNDPALADFTEPEREMIRRALCLLIDRNAICEEIAKQGQRPAASIVPAGMTDSDGTDFSARNGVDGAGGGYFSVRAEDSERNSAAAVELLRSVAKSSGKFKVSKDGVCSDFPELTYLTSNSSGHVEIAKALAERFSEYGIPLKTTILELQDFLDARASGAYSMARFSWTAAYDDPGAFLTLWASGAGSNCIGLGQGEHGEYAGYTVWLGGTQLDGCTWAESYDALLYTVQSAADESVRSRSMHEAETLLMHTGALCPIYEYTDVYLCRDSFKGLYAGPTAALYFMRTYSE